MRRPIRSALLPCVEINKINPTDNAPALGARFALRLELAVLKSAKLAVNTRRRRAARYIQECANFTSRAIGFSYGQNSSPQCQCRTAAHCSDAIGTHGLFKPTCASLVAPSRAWKAACGVVVSHEKPCIACCANGMQRAVRKEPETKLTKKKKKDARRVHAG